MAETDPIVANDFTQVLSDGIGYWALNRGRPELVSVFTYYAHIGYLAENGGIHVQQTETIPTEHLVVLQKDLILQKLPNCYGKQPKW